MKCSLKNKIATYALLGALILPSQSQGAWYWPFGGKKEVRKSEQVSETRRENTIRYLEEKGAKPLPKIFIPSVMQDDSTFTAPIYDIVEVLKAYLDPELKELARNQVAKAEINLSRNREELTNIASSDSVTADVYTTYSTPRTDIYPEEELPILYDFYRQTFEQANTGDTTAIRLKAQLDPYFGQLEANARMANIVSRNLDEVVSPIEKEANSHWYSSPWFYVPTAGVLGTTGYVIGKGKGGKGGEQKVEGGRYGGTGVH